LKNKENNKEESSKVRAASLKYKHYCWEVVAHAFNPSTWEAEAGEFLNSRLACSTE
jgi:major histocompatibility complex class I